MKDFNAAAHAENAAKPASGKPDTRGKGDQQQKPAQTEQARMHSKDAKVKETNPDAASGKVHQRSLGEGQK